MPTALSVLPAQLSNPQGLEASPPRPPVPEPTSRNTEHKDQKLQYYKCKNSAEQGRFWAVVKARTGTGAQPVSRCLEGFSHHPRAHWHATGHVQCGGSPPTLCGKAGVRVPGSGCGREGAPLGAGTGPAEEALQPPGLQGGYSGLGNLYFRNATIFMLFVFSVITSLLFSHIIYGSPL